jgi:hypothetical protein
MDEAMYLLFNVQGYSLIYHLCPQTQHLGLQASAMCQVDTNGSSVSQLNFLRAELSPFPWLWFQRNRGKRRKEWK